MSTTKGSVKSSRKPSKKSSHKKSSRYVVLVAATLGTFENEAVARGAAKSFEQFDILRLVAVATDPIVIVAEHK